jgi:hypothetical protein
VATASYEVDELRFPLVWVHYRRNLEDGEFEALLSTFERMMRERTRRYVLVLETHHSAMTSFSQARRQAMWMKEHQETLRKQVLGIALVLPSPVLRGVLKVVLQLQPMPVPYAVFRDAAEAEAWAQQRLAR